VWPEQVDAAQSRAVTPKPPSQEFSDLIVAQRAFEANYKAVTTFDTVTQETINMIH
jgi:flagellar basal body rod protein FlgC